MRNQILDRLNSSARRLSSFILSTFPNSTKLAVKYWENRILGSFEPELTYLQVCNHLELRCMVGRTLRSSHASEVHALAFGFACSLPNVNSCSRTQGG